MVSEQWNGESGDGYRGAFHLRYLYLSDWCQQMKSAEADISLNFFYFKSGKFVVKPDDEINVS